MIKRSVWEKPNKEWGVITKSMIEKNWSLVPGSFPSDKMLSHVKGLGKSEKYLLISCKMKALNFW